MPILEVVAHHVVADEQLPPVLLVDPPAVAAHKVHLAIEEDRLGADRWVQGLDEVPPVDVPTSHLELPQLPVVLDGLRFQLGCE